MARTIERAEREVQNAIERVRRCAEPKEHPGDHFSLWMESVPHPNPFVSLRLPLSSFTSLGFPRLQPEGSDTRSVSAEDTPRNPDGLPIRPRYLCECPVFIRLCEGARSAWKAGDVRDATDAIRLTPGPKPVDRNLREAEVRKPIRSVGGVRVRQRRISPIAQMRICYQVLIWHANSAVISSVASLPANGVARGGCDPDHAASRTSFRCAAA